MAKKETINEPKNLIEPVPEEVRILEIKDIPVVEEANEIEEVNEVKLRKLEKEAERKEAKKNQLAVWVPKTQLGKLVKEKKEKDIDYILEKGKKILEPEIVDFLLPLESDLLLIGQAKGKFGGSTITLYPAPRGTGLCVADECKKILRLTGIKDIYSRTNKRTRTTFNLAKACLNALKKTTEMEI